MESIISEILEVHGFINISKFYEVKHVIEYNESCIRVVFEDLSKMNGFSTCYISMSEYTQRKRNQIINQIINKL